MAVKLNESAFTFARELILARRFVYDERGDWNEHQPPVLRENEFIEQHGMGEYARWHLGIDDEQDPRRKGRYKFPYGDFENVHRCGLLAAESRAGRFKYHDVELAIAHLHGMIEALH